jgi:hypothetical protein
VNATSHRPRLGALAALAAALAASAACPLPQPLPGVTRIDGGTITPPRIAVASAQPSGTIVYYDETDCGLTGRPGFALGASVVDQNTDEVVDVRWFVDYDKATFTMNPWGEEQIPAPADPEQFIRTVTAQRFNPVSNAWSAPNPPPHVVELVVTNGGFTNDPLPSRSPVSGYEVEIFRWVFQPRTGAGCGP